MKLAFATLAAGLAFVSPYAVAAQDHSGHAGHHGEATARLTIDSPIEALMADAKAKAIVAKHMDGQDVSQHPMYGQFKAMSLKEVAPFSQGAITDAALAAIATDLAKL